MADKFKFEIITPENTIYNKDSEEVTIPSYEGLMTILKDHIPLVTFLRPGIITVKNDETRQFYTEEGTVEFSNNKMLILTSRTYDTQTLEKSKINEMIEEATKDFNKKDIDDKMRFFLSHKIDTLKEIT